MFLLPGDIVLTRSETLLGRVIRFFTRRIGESRTQVNHVGMIVTRGKPENAFIVEALHKVKRHKLIDGYGRGQNIKVAIYRPINLSNDEIKAVVLEAEAQVGKKYGYLKLITHALDWVLLGAYVFRRLTQVKKYPICSYLVANAYAVIGKDFDVEAGGATPDDIWDFVTSRSDKYKCVQPLALWEDAWKSKDEEE